MFLCASGVYFNKQVISTTAAIGYSCDTMSDVQNKQLHDNVSVVVFFQLKSNLNHNNSKVVISYIVLNFLWLFGIGCNPYFD